MKGIFLCCKDCYDGVFRVEVQSMSVVKVNVMSERNVRIAEKMRR